MKSDTFIQDKLNFSQNDPFDRETPVQMVVPALVDSPEFMSSIRSFNVPPDAIAVWFFGQNGFVVKDRSGLLTGIDLYLTNSCAERYAHLPFRLDRQLPVFVEPEDLDIDVFITTHSHQDHCDLETLRRLTRRDHMRFVGPFDSQRLYREAGLPNRILVHPGETLELNESVSLQACFALPTDNTDVNHMGVLLSFANGIRFYNTGDTAYAQRLATLLPEEVDICTICVNGGFHNLACSEAVEIIRAIHPKIAIPCHYDMLVNNVVPPEMFRVSLEAANTGTVFHQMRYYEPWVYQSGRF
jgi:L-ascorbate 6-phosphate lactonase